MKFRYESRQSTHSFIIIYAGSYSTMPATSGQNKHLAAAHAKGKSIQAEKQAALASETVTDDLWNSLQAAKLRIEELEQQLAQKDAECHRLQSELEKSNQKLQNHKDSFAFWK